MLDIDILMIQFVPNIIFKCCLWYGNPSKIYLSRAFMQNVFTMKLLPPLKLNI